MRAALMVELARHGGVLPRATALAVVPEHIVDDAVRSGGLVTVFPGVYAEPRLADDITTRRRAALAYTGGALSHLDGLDCWSLCPAAAASTLPHPVHVTVGHDRGPTRCRGVVVHRRVGFTGTPPHCVTRRGLQVVTLEQAVVESWPLLSTSERRSPIIRALRERRTTPQRLLDCLGRNPRCPGVQQMRELVVMVTAGAHSELEIYGHGAVLSDPRLPHARRQVPVRLQHGLVYLDAYYDEEMVALEFDGAAYHGSKEQRERDVRRDAELATLGILVVRLTHKRLHANPETVVTELVSILAARRRQLPAS